jgi:hypothetical protein
MDTMRVRCTKSGWTNEEPTSVAIAEAAAATTTFTYESAFSLVNPVNDPATQFAYDGPDLVSVTDSRGYTNGMSSNQIGAVSAAVASISIVVSGGLLWHRCVASALSRRVFGRAVDICVQFLHIWFCRTLHNRRLVAPASTFGSVARVARIRAM